MSEPGAAIPGAAPVMVRPRDHAAEPDLRPPPPRELQLEVTGACNLRCHMCLVRYRPAIDRVSGSLRPEEVAALVESIPGLERLTLQGLGEPLLAPGLVAMVRHAAARGVAVGFNTNATLLRPRRAEELVHAGLSWLHVSVDGATPATYESVRDGARWDRMERGLRSMVEAKVRLGADHPDLSITFVAMRRNVSELPLLVQRAAAWGVPRVRVQNLSHSFDDCDPAGDYGAIRRFAAAEALWGPAAEDAGSALATAAGMAERLGVELRLPGMERSPAPARRPGERGCGWPWDSAYVTHDGTVQPCCMVMGSDRVSLGNIREEPFTSIWHGAAYRRFRAGLLSADRPPEVCAGCSLYQGVF